MMSSSDAESSSSSDENASESDSRQSPRRSPSVTAPPVAPSASSPPGESSSNDSDTSSSHGGSNPNENEKEATSSPPAMKAAIEEKPEEDEEEEEEEEASSSSSSDGSESDDEEEAEARPDQKRTAEAAAAAAAASDSGSEQTSDSEEDSPRAPHVAKKKKLLSSGDSEEGEDDQKKEADNKEKDAEKGEKSFASFLMQKDVFGSDSDTSEDDKPRRNGHVEGGEEGKKTEMAIFGDVDDLSSEDEAKRGSDRDSDREVHRRSDDEDMDGEREGAGEAEVDGDAEQAAQEPMETQIAVDLPHIKVDLGKGIHFVKMPNFLSVETRPFDPAFYEDELIEDEVMDEEGRTRLKLKVENTMRWRLAHDEDGVELHDSSGNPIHESNTRIVRWSDGSMSLHLGTEIFDVHVMDTMSDYNHLFIRQGSGLQGQAIFRSKLTFRPHSTDSFTHRKITMSLADKSTKQQKVKVLPIVGKDPEANRTQLIKKEEEKLRASLRRENETRRRRERDTRRALSENFLEQEGNEDDENAISVNAIKDSVKKKRSVAAIYSSDESDDSGDSADSLSDTPVRKKSRTKVLSDDEEEGQEGAEEEEEEDDVSESD